MRDAHRAALAEADDACTVVTDQRVGDDTAMPGLAQDLILCRPDAIIGGLCAVAKPARNGLPHRYRFPSRHCPIIGLVEVVFFISHACARENCLIPLDFFNDRSDPHLLPATALMAKHWPQVASARSLSAPVAESASHADQACRETRAASAASARACALSPSRRVMASPAGADFPRRHCPIISLHHSLK